MALFLQHKADGIQWAVWKMEESLEALYALLPEMRNFVPRLPLLLGCGLVPSTAL